MGRKENNGMLLMIKVTITTIIAININSSGDSIAYNRRSISHRSTATAYGTRGDRSTRTASTPLLSVSHLFEMHLYDTSHNV